MDVASYLQAHTSRESDEFTSCSSDSDSKSILDEDYYRNLPPPIPEETLLSCATSVKKSSMEESKINAVTYSDVLKLSHEKASEWSVKTTRKKRKSSLISKVTKNEPKSKENLYRALSNLSISERPVENHSEKLLMVDSETLSKLINEQVKKHFDQFKSEYELVPKIKETVGEDKTKENPIKTPTKPQNGSEKISQEKIDKGHVLVEKKAINKIYNYIDNVEKCLRAMVRNQRAGKEKGDDLNRIQHVLESLAHAQTALSNLRN